MLPLTWSDGQRATWHLQALLKEEWLLQRGDNVTVEFDDGQQVTRHLQGHNKSVTVFAAQGIRPLGTGPASFMAYSGHE